MNHIGSLIKEFRNRLSISQKTLAEDICSEKFIYLIEKGDRTPSAEMTKLIGNRLGVDLFDYFQYLDCKNPIEVREYMSKIILNRQKGNYKLVNEMLEKAILLPDFKQKPWCYEIDINRIFYMSFVEHRYEEAIEEVELLISRMDPKYHSDVYMANIYTLLSKTYLLNNDLENSKKALVLAQDAIQNKEHNSKYAFCIIGVRISAITLHYLSGEYKETIEEGMKLLEYHSENSACERIFYSYFFLAFAYYKLGNIEQALNWFKKGIFMVLIKDRPYDVYYISGLEVFQEMLNREDLDICSVNEFKLKYGNPEEYKEQNMRF